VITIQHLWRAASSPALTVHTGREETAHTAVYRTATTPLAQSQGPRLLIVATAHEGTGVPTAGFRASGVDVQARVIRMAVVDRNRLTDVPGVSPRGAPV
jgi:hypothetical protein